ncbi:MAG: c-type cytochrome [Gammaproteobacteria bacterium]|nr:c-type cytochrome [Gammaproteobacteria bacterium]
MQHAPMIVGPCLLASLTLCGCGARHTESAQQPGATVPAVLYEAHLEAGGLPPPGATLRNPHDGDKAVAHSGELLFQTMSCDGCHGAGAAGFVGPNLGDGRWRYGGADSEVFNSIYYGRPKGMPAFGGALGVEGIWSLVTYIRSLPPPGDQPTESWVEH